MGILNFLKKAGFRAAVPVATLVASAACSGLYEENFYANDYHPELSRSDSTILADTPNVRRVFVLFSFGYNNLSYDLKEDIEDVIASGVPEYGFDENVVLVLSQNLPNGYSYSQPSAPVLTHIYSRGEEIIRDTLKVYADTTVAARKAVVEDVLTIAKNRFPAKRYGILMSSHGTGWAPQGYCYSPPDKKNNSTIWSLNSGSYDSPAKYHEERPLLKSIGAHYNGSASRSIEIEIQDLADAIPMHLDYILFDACFMGCVEVAYELKDKCDMMCFSQTEILSNGMDYKNLLSVLFAPDGPDLKKCAENYFNMYKNQTASYMRSATISVVDCRKLDPLAEIVAKHSEKIRLMAETTSRNNVQGYFQPQYSRYHGIFYDIESIIKEAGATDGELAEFYDALDECVLTKYATARFLNEFYIKTHSGLSMYLPDADRYILNDYYKKLKWNQVTELVR